MLAIEVRTERSEILARFIDSSDELPQLIRAAQRPLSPALLMRFVNTEGDTVFNVLQLPTLRYEVEYLSRGTETELEPRFLELIDQALAGPHRYIHIIGE
jgi:hypothetical protein